MISILFATIISLCLGLLLGLGLGLSLVITKRKVLFSFLGDNTKIALIISSSLARLAAVALIFYLLLLHTFINPILVVIVALIVFWIFIFLTSR